MVVTHWPQQIQYKQSCPLSHQVKCPSTSSTGENNFQSFFCSQLPLLEPLVNLHLKEVQMVCFKEEVEKEKVSHCDRCHSCLLSVVKF